MADSELNFWFFGDNLISMNPDLFMSTLISKKFLRFVYKV